jgi:cytochrome b6-f complex iron-sulfur subunit
MNTGPSEQSNVNQVAGRRGFLAALGGLLALWLGALMYPVYRYLSPPATPDPFGKEGRIKVDKITASDVAEPGQGKNGGYAGRGLIVVRAGDGRLRAFDAKCTHAGCNVAFAGTTFACPCHGGIYDLSGKNVSGPPPRPLTELSVLEENGEIFVVHARSGARS